MAATLLERTTAALTVNGFKVYQAVDAEHAAEIILGEIVPEVAPETVSYGDSMTLHATGVLDVFRHDPDITFLDTFESGVAREDILERRRHALLADLFLTGTNAVTADGALVNLDMVGNRVAGLVYGPRHVVVVVGTNKIVEDEAAARTRIREIAAPQNAQRHDAKTPCAKTGKCMDCKSPDRICNVWTISAKSWPRRRIKVILIDQPLGL